MCVYTSTVKEHLNIISQVFTSIQTNGLKIKPKKSVIAFNKIHFLGHRISKRYQATDEDIIKIMMNITPPKTRKQVQALFGSN